MAIETETLEDEEKQMLEAAFEALNARDEARFKKLHDPEVTVHPFLGPDQHGVDTVAADQFEVLRELQITEYDLKHMIAEGDTVAARWTADPVMEGERTRMDLIGMFRFQGGKIKEVWLQGNPAPPEA